MEKILNKMKNPLLTVASFFITSCNAAVDFNGTSTKPISHEQWNQLLKKYVTADGKVNYKGFQKDSVELNKYLRLLSDNPPDESAWSEQEQLAYWINAYNAFTIKLILKYYPIKSIKDIGSSIQIPFVNTPWDVKFITIGKEKMDLNNIEHGVIRKKFHEPRIHFSIVCASRSCPKLRNEAFTADRLEEQLTAQAKEFLSDSFRNKVSANELQLSKILDWYSMDFPKGEKFIEFLNKYSPVRVNKNAKISYLVYNWELNE